MIFETPAALWGLLSLLLLALFSLWRQSAARAVVPSLHLWKQIPERNPPLRALRRPAWRWELLLQALALALLVVGLARPALVLDAPRPRRVALVVDTSPRLAAGGRHEKIRARAAALIAGELRGDDVALLVADPAPRKIGGPAEIRPSPTHVDLAPLLAVAKASAEHVLLLSDRAPSGVRAELFEGPAGNAGLVAFSADDRELFARIVNHGPARRASLRVNGAVESVDLPAGERAWSKKGDFSKADRVEVELEGDDGFDEDDRAAAVRRGGARVEVGLKGLRVPLLDRALAAIPGAAIRADAERPGLAVGVDAEPGPGEVRVKLITPAPLREPLSLTRPEPDHPLLRGVRDEELRTSGAGALPAGGRVLLAADGAPVLQIRGGVIEVSVSFEPGRWPSTPSWPIFWTNVIDSARRGAGSFEPQGLLDERESDVAGASRAPSEAPAAIPTGERRTAGLGGWAALLALGCLAAAWMLQRRGNG